MWRSVTRLSDEMASCFLPQWEQGDMKPSSVCFAAAGLMAGCRSVVQAARVALLMAIVLAIGCGGGAADSPVAPSPPGNAGAVPAGGALAQLAGSWGGTVDQGGLLYPIELTLDGGSAPGSRAGTVRYPTLACSGFWNFDGVSGSEYQMTERITQGAVSAGGNCLDPVQVILGSSASPRQLSVRYIIAGAVGATAALTPR